MKLSEEQKGVITNLVSFKKSNQTLAGLAGTGKTVILSHLHQFLDKWAVCAFTGKAVDVLRRKGIENATTIHSLIYVPRTDEQGNVILDGNNSPIFDLATNLDCDGIMIDEASMVSQELYDDLASFNLPMIFVGDHGQLEAIGEKVNLMEVPDFKLETIHRNAGPIAHFAHYVRDGFRPSSYVNFNPGYDKDKLIFDKIWNLDRHLYRDNYDDFQVICAFNKTRVEMNKKIRNHLGYRADFPVVGDRLICLRNDKNAGIFNGMQGKVVDLFNKPSNKMIFESNGEHYELLFNPAQFNQEKIELGDRDDPHPFDYAYATTCHKFQGSEVEEALVIEQKCSLWEHKRWAYTAASRPRNRLRWIS